MGLWFNIRDPFSHVLEYKRWKAVLKENALTYHAHDIMKAGLQEEKEPNPQQAFCPWACGDSLDTAYTTATQAQFKTVLKRLLGKDYVLTNEIKVREPISMRKRNIGGKQEISMRIPNSVLTHGISKERQRSSIFASHRRYIATVYQMMLREAALRDGQDPAGAWSQQELNHYNKKIYICIK